MKWTPAHLLGIDMDTPPSLIDRLITFLKIPQTTPEFLWTKTRCYRRRIEQVKTFWIVAGLIMLAAGHPAFILVACFFMTFLSFAFLEKD